MLNPYCNAWSTCSLPPKPFCSIIYNFQVLLREQQGYRYDLMLFVVGTSCNRILWSSKSCSTGQFITHPVDLVYTMTAWSVSNSNLMNMCRHAVQINMENLSIVSISVSQQTINHGLWVMKASVGEFGFQ